jgi:hypothetical protein
VSDLRARLPLLAFAILVLSGCFSRIKDNAGLVLVPGTSAPAYFTKPGLAGDALLAELDADEAVCRRETRPEALPPGTGGRVGRATQRADKAESGTSWQERWQACLTERGYVRVK